MDLQSNRKESSSHLEQPTTLPRWSQPKVKAERKKVIFSLQQKVWTEINQWRTKKSLSIETVLISIWAVLLWRYHDTDRLYFLVKLSQRAPLAIRLQIDPHGTFDDLVQQVDQCLCKSEAVYKGALDGFDHLLQISNKNDQINTGYYDRPFVIRFIWDRGLKIELHYSMQQFPAFIINQMSIHLTNILNHMILYSNQTLTSVSMLSSVEQDRILHQFNQTRHNFSLKQTIDQLIGKQAMNMPQKAAIVKGEDICTYRELHIKSNQLAHYLRKRGIEKGQVVGLLMDDSPWLIIGMLGIIKAGAAFLPIDPQYPLRRIQYIIQDSNLYTLLTVAKVEEPAEFQGQIIKLDQVVLDKESSSTPVREHQLDDPVYVIYTSGSTGYPKGVVVEHRALLNLVHWHQHVYRLTSEDVSTKYAGIGFDASVWEIFPTLAAGATIHIIPKEIRIDVDVLHQYFERHRITVSFLPTPVAEQFMKRDNASLRLLLTGGDQLKQVWKQSYQIANNYGPTENTVVTTSGFVHEQGQLITIGKPIANNQVYILNRFDQLQPIGVPGELCISGESLARGYLNQPDLTNQKFVEHPLIPGQRMYRTGDLARWLPDGQIEFLGRLDEQVKIRGFRIELGEIEATLMRHHKVKAAAITVENQGEQRDPVLCAYYVSNDSSCSIAELKSYLSKELPAYMVPTYWLEVEEIPLTPHGKVDKKSLPKITSIQIPFTALLEDQLQPIEKKLYQIWREIFGAPPRDKQDHFFHAGGHSIKAMQFIARIRQKIGIKITWTDLFAHPTFDDLSSFLLRAKKIEQDSIKPVAGNGPFPVSPVQRQIFALEQTRELGTTYHTPAIWLLKGELDLARIRRTIQCLIDRHEALRTSFQYVHGDLQQQIHEQVDWKIEMFTARDRAEAKQRVSEFIRPFDLQQFPLFRVGLVRISANENIFMLDFHHLICDGVSMGILHREFEQLYQGQTLPALSYQYKDFALWMQKLLAEDQLQVDEQYWRNLFQEEIPRLQLPMDYQRPAQQRFRGKKIRVPFSAALTRKCKAFSRQQHVTIYMTLFAVYSLLLAKMANQESFIVGSVVAGRTRTEWEKVFGMFVNTLPIPIHLEKSNTFAGFLQKVKQQVLAAQEHGLYPFATLVEKLGIKWDQSRNPLFDTVFVMQNMEIPKINLPALEIQPFLYEEQHSMFDLTWEVVEQETLELSVEYNTDLFCQQTIERMIDHFFHLLRQAITEPAKQIKDFALITEKEKELILTKFNPPRINRKNNQTVLELFAKQVELNPDKIAYVANEQSITYQRLDQESNQLAHLLQRKGICTEGIVAILSEASIEFIIGILAILKAGGAFLPIDPAYPAQRIQYLLEDSGASLVLYQKGVSLPKLPSMEALSLERSLWEKEASDHLEVEVNKHQLAYVIYTSGSTGKPKGVMIEHGSLQNLVEWHHEYYQITENDCSTKYAGVGFDASVWEIFPYLTKGATIYWVPPDKRHDLDALNQFFEENRITISFLPTAIAESFMELANSSLRLLLVGGDKLKRIRPTRYQVVNNYGPTENTVVTTCYPITRDDQLVIPIGRPIRNQQVYILNEDMQLQPVGVPGELCISGDGLARGYLHRPQLTREKFCPNPFAPKERMYRTGDLARWLPDGNIEFLGRMDDQVQIRGYRIELGEIESLLLQHPSVEDAVVLVQQLDEHSEQSLVAYVVGKRPNLRQELRDYLQEYLPEYMLPSYVIQLDTFPLTENGKVDRKALPQPRRDDILDAEYQPPSNATQQLLVEIWQEVLQQPKVGVLDNFFSLGGDSIKAIQVAARLQQHGKKLAVHQLLQHPTIQELAVHVEKHHVPINQKMITGTVPLTPIQRYFFAQHFVDKHHWNQAVMLSNSIPWEPVAVKQAFEQLVAHHDILRSRYFVSKNGRIEQRIKEVSETHFTVESFSFKREPHFERRIREEANRLQRSLNLQQGPLIRLAIFETAEQHELLIIMHHLLVDGVSWRILLDDFSYLYQGMIKQETRSLPSKTTSYQEWAQKLSKYANSSELLQEISYWEEMEKKAIPSLFQTNTVKSNGQLRDAATIQFCLTKEQTKALLEDVHHAYHTKMNDLLLAGLCLAIREWSQNHRLAVNLEGHGREAIFHDVDLTRTVGWFTTIYPVVFDLSTSSIPFMIKSVKETLRAVPNKGLGYNVLRYLTEPERRANLRFSLQPEISFNYLGQFTEEICFAGMGPNAKRLGDCFSPDSFVHPLEIYGAVIDEQLQFRFLFLEKFCQRTRMQRLVDLYQHFLVQIIQHCLEKQDPSWTPSDFSANDVSLEELDQFLQNLD